MSKNTNDGLTRSGMHRMLYSCTHMAAVGVKGLITNKLGYHPASPPFPPLMQNLCIH